MVRVFVEQTGRRILPFDDPVGEVLVGNRPLHEWQTAAFRDAGLTRCDVLQPPCLVVPDTLLASPEALTAFVAGAGGQDAVLVLGNSRFGEGTIPVQPAVVRVDAGWRFEAIRFVSGQDAPPRDVVVDPAEWLVDVPMPRQYTGDDVLKLGVPLRLVLTLHHWVHLLWANQLVGGVALRRTSRGRLLLRGAWAALRALSTNKWKILGKLNHLGRGCDIHPTAVLEGCTLGDRVVVGPFARLAFCEVGDGAVVMPGASVSFSVLGAGSLVGDLCVVRSCVLYPGSAASQHILQQSVLGRDAVTTKGGGTLDLSWDAPIKVTLDGRVHSTGLRVLGSAYGHRCRIGTGILLSPGRSVPNAYFLIRDPRTILSILPPGLPHQPLLASGTKARPSAVLGGAAARRPPGGDQGDAR